LLKRSLPAADDAANAAVEDDSATDLSASTSPAEISTPEPVAEASIEPPVPDVQAPEPEVSEAQVPQPEVSRPVAAAIAPKLPLTDADPPVEEAEVPAAPSTDAPPPTVIVDTSEEPAAGPIDVTALPPSQPEPPLAELETEIKFAVNSSYMTGDDHQSLRRLLDGLPAPGSYRLVLTAAVGAGDVEASDPDEDKRYNRWMAERRIERVKSYLEGISGNREIVFEPAFADDDNSREVRLQVVPQG